MDVFYYIYLGLFIAMVAAIALFAGMEVVRQRRTPMEKRIEEARKKLLNSEPPLGQPPSESA